jgi:hypothetical protein
MRKQMQDRRHTEKDYSSDRFVYSTCFMNSKGLYSEIYSKS